MKQVDQATQWVYQGIWGILTTWFRVPPDPPTLPVAVGSTIRSFRPAIGFLRYLKIQFWVVLSLIDGLILVGWLALTIAFPLAGIVLFLPALAIAVLPDILAWIAIHLRYDTTWYVISARSLRIRSGIWTIHEMTFTFDNVQNVLVTQGPLQRWFGIADIIVDTAGGGGAAQADGHHQSPISAHRGLIEGVSNAAEIRDIILQQLHRTRNDGVGDGVAEPVRATGPGYSLTGDHVALLSSIRDELRRMVDRNPCQG